MFLNLPDNIRESADFMALIEQACCLYVERSATKYSMAHRLRLLEEGIIRDGLGDVQAAREQLQRAEEALDECLGMLKELKTLIGTLSPGRQRVEFETSSYLSDGGSVGSDCVGVTGPSLLFD